MLLYFILRLEQFKIQILFESKLICFYKKVWEWKTFLYSILAMGQNLTVGPARPRASLGSLTLPYPTLLNTDYGQPGRG
jgi:hypothetical protein